MYKYVEDKNFDIGRELVLPKDLKELAEGFVSRLTHVVMHNGNYCSSKKSLKLSQILAKKKKSQKGEEHAGFQMAILNQCFLLI